MKNSNCRQAGEKLKIIRRSCSIVCCFLLTIACAAQKILFTVSMDSPATHYFHVTMQCENIKQGNTAFKLPVWTPGYYQKLDYAQHVENFRAADKEGNALTWNKTADNTWQVSNSNTRTVILTYAIKTTRPFVASPYINEERGYIAPAGVFFHIAKQVSLPATVTIQPWRGWKDVATGLEPVAGKDYTYYARDFDVLYDSPILIGSLEELPAFTVQGIPHRFIGYKLGDFDKVALMADLKKIVETSAAIIGDIPYRHYTFIGIGPGQGGIEHLNSTTVSFTGAGLDKRSNRLRMLHFLAHEYFHHYNVKRIRPIELGPFDYDKGSRTRQLWISEGLTVYYEYLVVKRAGLSSEQDLLEAIRGNIQAHEARPGRLHQSLAEASYETWRDGPFGRSGDEANKTISYYDKGPVVGLLFDFAIRHVTNNKKSLDDVMRTLYREYYQQKKRGFTEDEFRAVIKKVAGDPLDELFDYVYTTKEIDYSKYFTYAGLVIDDTFTIKRMDNPGTLQSIILKSWLKGNL